MLFNSRHEKDAWQERCQGQKRYAQHVEIRWECLCRKLYDLFPYSIDSLKKEVSATAPIVWSNIDWVWGRALTSSGPWFELPSWSLLLRKQSGSISRTCSVPQFAPFCRVPSTVHLAVGLQSLACCPRKYAESYPYFSLWWGPSHWVELSWFIKVFKQCTFYASTHKKKEKLKSVLHF